MQAAPVEGFATAAVGVDRSGDGGRRGASIVIADRVRRRPNGRARRAALLKRLVRIAPRRRAAVRRRRRSGSWSIAACASCMSRASGCSASAPEALAARRARAGGARTRTARRATSRCRCSASRPTHIVIPWEDATRRRLRADARSSTSRRGGGSRRGSPRCGRRARTRSRPPRRKAIEAIVGRSRDGRQLLRRAGRRRRACARGPPRCPSGSDRRGIDRGRVPELSVRGSGGARQRDAVCRRDRLPAEIAVRALQSRTISGAVQRQPAGEIGELLAQNQPAAVQPRLQRLILHRSIALASSVDMP